MSFFVVPKYERLAPKVKKLDAKRASIDTIARSLGTSWEVAREARDFARTGKRPTRKSKAGRKKGKGKPNKKYADLAEEVVRLREQQRLSFGKIAKLLKVHTCTATRAYDHAKPEAVRDAAEQGKRPSRGHCSRFGGSILDQIRVELRAGRKPAEIGRILGCGRSIVDRVKKAMDADARASKAKEDASIPKKPLQT